MNLSTDFIDVVEDLLIVILSIVFLYLLYFNLKGKNPAPKAAEEGGQRLFEVDMEEEGLKERKKEIEKSIEMKKRDYLQGKVDKDEYNRFLRRQHAILVSVNSKLRKS